MAVGSSGDQAAFYGCVLILMEHVEMELLVVEVSFEGVKENGFMVSANSLEEGGIHSRTVGRF
jgi:hypothetical protein